LIWPPASTGPEPPGSQQHKLFDPQAKHPKGYSAEKSGFIFLVVSPQEFEILIFVNFPYCTVQNENILLKSAVRFGHFQFYAGQFDGLNVQIKPCY
jgi:hypothetical protein